MFIVAVSKDIQNKYINNYYYPEDKIVVIHNGTDIIDRTPARIPGEYFNIGSSGRLVTVKDYPLMVEIARELSKSDYKFHFQIAGEGPEVDRIKDLIRRYNLEDVFSLRGFLGNTSDFYRSLDLYLNTSLSEGVPMSVLEAMAHGIPVIAPSVGGFKEIITDGVQGFLVEGRAPKDFAERCINLYHDRELKIRMGESARERILENFTVETMARKYYSLYRNCIGGQARQTSCV